MPSIYTKKQLFRKYYYLPFEEAQATLNEIICRNRGLDYNTGKLKRILLPQEVKEFLKVYDIDQDVN